MSNFKEFFFKLNEMPHAAIHGGDYDYEIEFFKPTTVDIRQKFQELAKYIKTLTIGDDRIVYGPFNDSSNEFISSPANANLARKIFLTNEWIQDKILNWFGNLIHPEINPQKIPIKKRDKKEIELYQRWINSLIEENKSIVFENNNINNIK